MSLVLKSGLLTWIEAQLISVKVSENVEWVKILDNIMAIVDANKVEAATEGGWRSTICRCLCILMERNGLSYLLTWFFTS
jgi:nucleolar pre-ribosomal-associated protein 1